MNQTSIPSNEKQTSAESRKKLLWSDIQRRASIRLYAGAIPEMSEYDGWAGLSIEVNDARHLLHDITTPIPLPDNSVDAFQAEDVFEHIRYNVLVRVVNEIFRILKPGGYFRLSVPDYRCKILRDRSEKDQHGNLVFDPAGGGTVDDPGHVWFPVYESVKAIIEKSQFAIEGEVNFYHYYDESGKGITRPIDYSKGNVRRTPDHDDRVRAQYCPLSIVVDMVKKKVESDARGFHTEYHGTEYGGWAIVPENLNETSIVYSFGIGEDISFDLSLIQKYGVNIVAFDPTPKSIRWLNAQALPEKFRWHEYGLADFNGTVKFYPPENPDHVSHTIAYRSSTAERYIEVPVKTFSTICRELGHSRIDILKMDIEGAEYSVIDDIVDSGIEITQILVEFHDRFEGFDSNSSRTAIRTLERHGYEITAISSTGNEYSFIKRNLHAKTTVPERLECVDVPVVLIAYNRPQHTKEVLASLKSHNIRNLYVFCDAPRSEKDRQSVEATRKLIREIDWTTPVVTYQTANQGLARSIVQAADTVFEKYDRLILLEDDCVPQQYFFDFMNACLERYKDNERIFGISGYSVQVPEALRKDYPYDLYFAPRIGSWGWATWKRAWQKKQIDLGALRSELTRRGIDLEQGGDDVPSMLDQMIRGTLKDVWTMSWILTVYLNKGYYIYPTESHIKNIGMDGSGVHCGTTDKFNTLPATRKPTRYPFDVLLDRGLYDNFRSFYDQRPSVHAARTPHAAHASAQLSTAAPSGVQPRRGLKVVHLCMQDFGGAGTAAYRLHRGLVEIGVDSTMLVFNKQSKDPTVKVLPSSFNGPTQCLEAETYSSPAWAEHWTRWTNIHQAYPNRPSGLEVFSDLVTDVKLEMLREIQEADVINLHWVAGMLDVDSLPGLSKRKILVWTLHDMNAFTGGCHYTNGCLKYETQCGACPQLGSSDPRDAAFATWNRRKAAYAQSDLQIVTPSQWLAGCVRRSSLMKQFGVDVIPYGFPLDMFRPDPAKTIRKELSLSPDRKLITFVADDTGNRRKGMAYLLKAFESNRLKKYRDRITFGIVGAGAEDQYSGLPFPVVRFGTIRDQHRLSQIYASSDVFVIPSLEDNLPNTVVEALATGTPVVGFKIGGIPDMVKHQINGFLAEPADSESLAEGIAWIIKHSDEQFRQRCRRYAEAEYDLHTQAQRYASIYGALRDKKSRGTRTALSHDRSQAEDGKKHAAPEIVIARDRHERISIVTPSFNQAEYLEETIDSVLSQGYPNLEYVIMDGGSTDGSVGIIKKYEKYLSYWQSRPDNGQYGAINDGFTHTTGPIMTWLNSDDKFHPNALWKVESAFCSHPSIEWICGRPTYWDIAGTLTGIHEFMPVWKRSDFLKKKYDDPFIQQESTFWKRSLWELAGGRLNTNFDLAADLELWMRFFRYTDLFSFDALVGGWRRHDDQKSSAQRDRYIAQAVAIIEHEQAIGPVSGSGTPRAKGALLRYDLNMLQSAGLNHAIDRSERCWKNYGADLRAIARAAEANRRTDILELLRAEFGDAAGSVNRVSGLLARAEDLIGENKLEAALAILHDIIEIDPANLDALNDMAVIEISLNHLEAAVRLLDRVLTLDGANATAINNLQYLNTLAGGGADAQPSAAPRLPSISVITPSFNNAKFIEQTIQSVLEQKYPSFEHIVMDGGSTDGTVDILKRYDHIQWVSEKDDGQSDAINKGFARAEGEIIAWINSDDWYEPGAFIAVGEYFAAHPDENVVMGDCNLIDANGVIFDTVINVARGFEELSRWWIGRSIPTQPAIFFRKRLLDECGVLDRSLHYTMDYDLWMRFAGNNRFNHIDRIVANYRFHPDAKIGDQDWTKIHPELRIVRSRYCPEGPDGTPPTATAPQPSEKGHAATDRSSSPASAADDPLISVVIPCYNYGGYLPEALESVIKQTYQNFEIIIVNDGSTDNSAEVARELIRTYPAHRIRLIDQPNSGQPAITRNNGIREARGTYILPLDADDILYPSFLESTLRELQRSGCDVVYTDQEYFGMDKKIVRTLDYDRNMLFAQSYFGYCSLYKKAMWSAVGGYKHWGYEDWEFWISCAEAGYTFRRLPEVLFRYRVKSESMFTSAQKHDQRLKAQIVLNHPSLYSKSTVEAARRLIESGSETAPGASAPAPIPEQQRSDADGRFTVVAIISAYNEGDVIHHVIGDLIANGVDVYLLDNNSTDNTVEQASPWLGKGLLHIERFPDDCGYPVRNKKEYVWRDILRRKEEIAQTLKADWFIHADADEFRESPFPETTLAQGIRMADEAGFSAINFELVNFRPVNDDFTPGSDVRLALRHYEKGEWFDSGQIKAWKKTSQRVDLVSTGGHSVGFAGRKVYPIPFILRHYPIRGECHGRNKVFQERLGRFAKEERAAGWHVQYDEFADAKKSFLYDERSLVVFDGQAYREELLNRAKKKIDLYRSQFGGEATQLEQAVIINPYDVHALKRLSDLYLAFELVDQALMLLERLAKALPGDTEVKRMIGVLRSASSGSEQPKAPAQTPLVSIIIPVFNKAELTRACIEAIDRAEDREPYEVIIVDNASTDGTKAYLQQLRGTHTHLTVIENKTNLGFAKANNLGARAASGKYLLFLNNDTEPSKGWLCALLRAFGEVVDAGIVGAKLLYPNRTIQHAGIEFLQLEQPLMIEGFGVTPVVPDHPYRNEAGTLPEANTRRMLDMVTGACLMIEASLFAEAGGFDESYLNGCEDIDLCLKVRQMGRSVVYEPQAVVIHHEGQSEGRFAHVRKNLEHFFRTWGAQFDASWRFRPALSDAANAGKLPAIAWEGSQFVYHSLALINREMCMRLASDGAPLSVIPYEADTYKPDAHDPARVLQGHINKEIGEPAIHVRLQWPPNLVPPQSGRWVINQPWEFGALPVQWVDVFSRSVDELWVISSYVRDCYIASGVPAERVVVVPCGFDPKKFNPRVKPAKLKTKKKFKFLFVGGTIYRKGIDLLVDAYTQAFTKKDNVCLVIKDMGGNSFYKGMNFKDKIAELRKTPNAPEIEYIDAMMTEQKIAGLYAACDVLVHPYRGEGFGLPILEAMACGVPAIVPNGGACLDFCTEANSLLIEAPKKIYAEKRVGDYETAINPWLLEPSLEDLKAKMRFAASHPAELKQKGRQAHDDAHASWTWDHAYDKLKNRVMELKDKPIRRFAQADPERVLGEAEDLLGEGKIAEAADILRALLEQEPENVHVLNDLAVAAIMTKNYPSAADFLSKVLTLDPANESALGNLNYLQQELSASIASPA